MNPPENSSPTPTPKQSLLGKIRNRLAPCLVAGAATGAAMGCAPATIIQPIHFPLDEKQRSDIREEILRELEARRMCSPFDIEVNRKQVRRIGLSQHEERMVELFPAHDAIIQRLLLCHPEDLRDEGHALNLLKRDIRVVRFLHESMLRNADFMLTAATVDNRVLDYAHSSLFEIPKFIMKIVQLNPKNIKYAFPYHINNPGLFVKLIEMNPRATDYLPKHISSNPEFIASVGALDPRAYLFHDVDIYKRKGNDILTNPVWSDKDYARMITGSNHKKNLKFVDSKLRSDVDFMLELMEISTSAFHYRDYSVRGDERLTRAYLQTIRKGYNDRVPIYYSENEIDDLMSDLKELNIEHPDRFKLDTLGLRNLRIVIRNRKSFAADLAEEKEKRKKARRNWGWHKKKEESPEEVKKTPITLQIAAKADWNAAFVNGVSNDFIIRGKPFLYFEANTRREAFSTMDDLLLMEQPVNDFIVTAHGSQQRMALGAPDPRLVRPISSQYYFGLGDRYHLQRRRDLMTNDGRLIFQSCSVGEGDLYGRNIANVWHDAFPQARIYAAKVPTRIEQLFFDKNNELINVGYASGYMSTYQMESKPVQACLTEREDKFNTSESKVFVKQSDLDHCRATAFIK